MDKGKCSPQVKVLNWGKTNYNNIRQELKNVDWGQMFEGKSTSSMREAFKCKLLGIQDRHIPVRMKDKYGIFWEPWITRDIVSVVKEKICQSWEHTKQVWNTRKVERNLSKE